MTPIAPEVWASAFEMNGGSADPILFPAFFSLFAVLGIV